MRPNMATQQEWLPYLISALSQTELMPCLARPHCLPLRAVVKRKSFVRQLLAHVAHPDREEVFRTTPLSYVIHELGDGPAEPKRTQLVAVVRSLLEAGANPRGGSDRHQTPLALAREYGMEDVSALLAEYIQS
jgi:hypothetical protein